ncbi:MAG: hypothetical protein IJ165_03540 [Proteobacteria bacterium]|nr:hypothetical protein [Pseudomonadota bacterium]
MKKLFRNTALLLTAALCLGLTACSDEDQANEEEKPLIYESIEAVYESIGHETNCGKITQYLSDNSVNNQRMEKACTEYNKSLADNKNDPKKLSHNMDNSGYYMAAYLLTDKLSDSIDTCTGENGAAKVAAEAFVNFFKANKCDTYLDDAQRVTARK